MKDGVEKKQLKNTQHVKSDEIGRKKVQPRMQALAA